MREISFRKQVLITKFDGELRAALASKIIGVRMTSDTDGFVIVDDATTPADETTIANLIAAHDPTPIPDPMAVAANAAKTEATTDSQTAALMAATPGQIGAWYDGLTSGQKSAVGRVAVIKLVEHEKRLQLLEKRLGL